MIERWREASGAVKAIAVLLAGVVVLNVGSYLFDKAIGPRADEGPASSSYTRGPDGFAAWAELLERNGIAVQRLREPVANTRLPSSTLVVLADAAVGFQDAAALKRFVIAGGNLIVAGAPSVGSMGSLTTGATPSAGRPAPASAIAAVPQTAGVRSISPATGFSSTGNALPVIAGESGTVVAVASFGRFGRVVEIADAGFLRNASLKLDDNAAFALSVTASRKTVIFVEYPHGFGSNEGLAALPNSWKWAAAGLLIAVLVWMLAAGRRLGPPDPSPLDQMPQRSAYVTSMARTLSRTKSPGLVLAPVRAHIVEQLSSGFASTDIKASGRKRGLSDAEIEAVLSTDDSPEAILAVGRALARMQSGEVS